ncbi:hypothetical protein EJB05_56572, partial [Eragrostis curvula]
MDFLEASTLEEHDSLLEHESFFLENPQETCSYDSSLESSPVSAKTTFDAYNHLVVIKKLCSNRRVIHIVYTNP